MSDMPPNNPQALPELRIEMSHRKTALLLLASLAFVSCGLWLILGARAHLVSGVIGGGGILFFGACGAVAIKMLIQKNAGLTMDADGVLDQSSATSVGFIPWADVSAVQPSFVSGQKFVSLMLHDPDQYAQRGNAFQRRLARMNIKLVGTPVNFSANSMKISFDELLDLMQRYHRHHQSN